MIAPAPAVVVTVYNDLTGAATLPMLQRLARVAHAEVEQLQHAGLNLEQQRLGQPRLRPVALASARGVFGAVGDQGVDQQQDALKSGLGPVDAGRPRWMHSEVDGAHCGGPTTPASRMAITSSIGMPVLRSSQRS